MRICILKKSLFTQSDTIIMKKHGIVLVDLETLSEILGAEDEDLVQEIRIEIWQKYF